MCLLAAPLLVSGCGQSGSRPAADQTSSDDSRAVSSSNGTTAGTVLVSAAASTQDVLAALIEHYDGRSRTEVRLNTGPSSGLATQILAGAPADLFLSANTQWAQEVEHAGLAKVSVRLLTNRLVLIVPESNPAGVHGPDDLLSEAVTRLSLAGESVPAGIYADQALNNLGLLDSLQESGKIARGQDIRSALSYVERREAEAGIVYATDLAAAAGVTSVYEFDPALHDEIVYVLVRVKSSNRNPVADQFFDYLQSDEALPIYGRFGFERYGAGNASETGAADQTP